jgi:hypothetical protein
MDDAESFLGWCANRNISLILHGHKHVPRYREELVRRTDGNSTLITTVGCGTLWEQKAGHSRTTSLGGTRSLGAGRSLFHGPSGWKRIRTRTSCDLTKEVD